MAFGVFEMSNIIRGQWGLCAIPFLPSNLRRLARKSSPHFLTIVTITFVTITIVTITIVH